MLTETVQISFLVFASLTGIVYVFVMFTAFWGWYKIKHFNTGIQNKNVNVSLLVAFRNEEKHIPLLLESLKKQTVIPSEIIFINDHSTDNSCNIIDEARRYLPTIRLIQNNLPHSGKKAALKCGLAAASGEWILQTDADCIVAETWIETYISFINQNKDDVLIAGPVSYSRSRSVFFWFFELDLLSLVITGAGFTGAGRPVYCNGANMAYRREDVMKMDDPFRSDIPSGDDVFLIQQLASKRKRNISFLKSNEASVQTAPPDSLSEFFGQRIRWGSKTTHYISSFARWLALIVFTANLLLIAVWVFLWAGYCHWLVPVLFTSLKMMTDTVLIITALKFTKKHRLIPAIIPACIIYPFYLSGSAILVLIRPAKKTKRL